MAGELSLALHPHRKAYPVLDSPQQAYLLVEVKPTAAAPAVLNQAVNLCLVLDRSGSMAGAKLEALKRAAQWIVDRLSPQDLLSIVIFDDAEPAEVVLPCTNVSDRQAIQRKIAAIEERGGTHMSTGMRLGLQELLAGRSPHMVSSMILLTDGQTWEDQEACRQLADRCGEAGIPIQVFGLGLGEESNWDPRLLEDIARRSGGEWMPIEKPDDVATAFEKALRAMQGAVATNVHLILRLSAGVTPRTVWRATPLISRLDHHAVGEQDVQVFLGEVRRGVGQALLADLLLPPRLPGQYRMVQAEVLYDVPGLGLLGERVTAELSFTFSLDSAQTAVVDERLMNLIEKVVAHKLQTQALDDAAAGNLSRATQRLRAAATRLLELGEVELAQQAEQKAEQIEKEGRVDLASEQRMRYATKRLTELES